MFRIETIQTPGLGNHSYLATDGIRAVAVDPQRDIDRVLAVTEGNDLRLTHVFETHLHNDYVTGGLELASRAGARYLISADDAVGFERHPVREGDTIETGDMRLRALHTPGHTHHHLSYVLENGDGTAQAVFTGGSMLFGTTGRTDLVGPEYTEDLAHQQFHSVRRLANELPPETKVFPTHGFGSFCAVTPAVGDSSTIARERSVNVALTRSEQVYVDSLLAGLDVYPAYYARMSSINRRGPEPVDLSLPARVEPAELRRRLDAGEWVVDLRDRTAFAAGHLAGSLGFELAGNFVTYLGWLYQWGTPLTLIGETIEQVAEARRELVRIGIDSLDGVAIGEITTLADAERVRSYPVSDFDELARALPARPVHVLDLRRADERALGGVRGSQHIPLHELRDRLGEVPEGEVWVYCGSGYRSSIAASMLDRPGRDVVLVNDRYDSARAAGLEG